MQLKRVFVENIASGTDSAVINGKEALYVTKVLRMKKGESLIILDGQGHAFESIIDEVCRREVKVRITNHVSPPQPSPLNKCLGKADVERIGRGRYFPLSSCWLYRNVLASS